MFSSIAHKIVPRPRFVHVLDCDQILVIRALNCARLCVVRALNCARILVVRTLDCAQFLVAPCPFPNLAGTLGYDARCACAQSIELVWLYLRASVFVLSEPLGSVVGYSAHCAVPYFFAYEDINTSVKKK